MARKLIRGSGLLMTTWVLPATLLSSCGGAGSSPLTVVRDSSGVEIVENLHTPDDVPTYAVLNPEPFVQLGVMEGNPDQEFGRIYTAAYLVPDKILVVDSQARLFSIFSLEGDLIDRFGGQGSGPGEFGLLGRVDVLRPDTILVWDRRNRRISAIPTAGGTTEALPLTGEISSRIRTLDFFSDGTILAQLRSGTSGSLAEGTSLVSDSTGLVRLSRSGEMLSDLGTFFRSEFISQIETQGQLVRNTTVMPLFAHSSSLALSGTSIFYGDNARFRIDSFDPEGRLMRSLRAPGLEAPLSSDMVSETMAIRSEQMGGDPGARRDLQALVEAYPLPENVPAFGQFEVDKAGFLWVRAYEPDPDAEALWHVFDGNGFLLGRVTVPAESTIYEIGEDYMLLRPPHEFDLPTVQLHRLDRSPSGTEKDS